MHKTSQMHSSTSPTCFEGPRGRQIRFRDPGPENRFQMLLNCVHQYIPVLFTIQGAAAAGPCPPVLSIALDSVLSYSPQITFSVIRQVIVSLVGPSGTIRTGYDHLYPANLLRQAAVDAAQCDLVLQVLSKTKYCSAAITPFPDVKELLLKESSPR